MKDNENEKRQAGAYDDASKTQKEDQLGQAKDSDLLQESGGTAVQSFSWKRLMAKKWVFPAVYLAAAAIILSIMWAIQNDQDEQLLVEDPPGEVSNEINQELDDAFPVSGTPETWAWPVQDSLEVEVVRSFYDINGTNEAKQAATIQYGNTLQPSMGVTLSRPDGETFPVLAAISGIVTRVEELPVAGYVVELEHDHGLTTIYSSLANVTVSEGDLLSQGEQFAEAGRSEMGQDLAGEQLHFEVLEHGEYLNPTDMLP